jgi:hypothetical protein
MPYVPSTLRACALAAVMAASMDGSARGGDYFVPTTQKASPVPAFAPRRAPVVTGEFIVGVITIRFKETRMEHLLSEGIRTLEKVKETFLESGHADSSHYGEKEFTVTQEEYFKIFSNGIAWPKLATMPNEGVIYQDPNFYGYYCEFDSWTNPFGWKDEKEGRERVVKMNQNALRFANNSYRGPKPVFLCYNYITTRPETPDPEIREELRPHYTGEDAGKRKKRSTRPSKTRRGEVVDERDDLGPWFSYAPICRWGQPMWPNSKIQINDFQGGVFAHEVGHCLGAPDTYHAPRYNDGISGAPCPFAYGPTSHAFSRYYHHAYIQERNHPTIKASGSYTLHPRHIDPKGDEAVGYLIPSNHPHYLYQVEYVYDENDSVGIGPSHEGMLVTVINLGLTSYLGSPDYAYVYRPNDPFFRGKGDVDDCFFGKTHGRTSFTMDSNPSARLPNLLDGGVSLSNIEEREGTLTFDVQIDRKPVTGSEYTNSMLPQIRLEPVTDVQATSFTMDCTIKFRGEPLKTIYGFCWSTSRNPTVRDQNFILAHREWYRGHAIGLKPNTTYYVRAFATNGLGIRYSDEEEVVKTADPEAPPANIGPLFTDAFSQNEYLFRRYSNVSTGYFLDYSPVCTLAKLVAYYRPDKFPATRPEESKQSRVDFNQLSWNPGQQDNPKRLLEIDAFFGSVYRQIRTTNLHEMKPGKELVAAITTLAGTRGRPVVDTLTGDNAGEVCKRIRKDLELSRPVLLVYARSDDPSSEHTRWALVDGVTEEGEFHVDFPMNSEFQIGEELTPVTTGYRPPGELMIENYSVMVITSLPLSK